MFRSLSSIVLLVVVGLASCGAAPPVIRICVREQNGDGRCGVGTTSRETPYIITAGHVLETVGKGALISVTTNVGVNDGRGTSLENTVILAGSTIKFHDENDVALLYLPVITDSSNSLPLCTAKLDEKVIIHTGRGEVNAVVTLVHDNFVMMQGEIIKGDSGSAIVSEERECIVGIATMLIKKTENGVDKTVGIVGVSSHDVIQLIGGK